MFFSISRSTKSNFSVNGHYHRGWHLDMDQGWNITEHNRKTVAWKGYLDHGDLDFEIYNIVDNNITRSGNYCAIVLDDDTARIHHSLYRSFPLWYDPEHGVTNLRSLSRKIFADSSLTLNKDLTFYTTSVDVIGDISNKEYTVEQVLQQVDEILTEKFDYFFSYNNLPVKIFLSGGIDTTLMYSYLKKLKIPHEVVLAEHNEFDRFWVRNHHTITSNHWAYTQIHHWLEPTILVSGCPGDEYSLRNPEIANMLAMHHGTSINHLLNNNQNCLHRNYFLKSEHQAKFAEQTLSTDINDAIKDRDNFYQFLLSHSINDYQHWHLGNTLTFTPMRSLEILKLFLSLPWEDQITQILDSALSKKLIERNDPALLDLLSRDKNHENFLENLAKLLPR